MFLCLFIAIYLGLAITPSSYAIGLRLLGQPIHGLFAGTPRTIRSDEWIVFTPYVQIAVNSGFSAYDKISPYHESLRAFFALPIADWAAIFKPYYAAFAVLPAANAFSFFYLFDMAAFIVGWGIFFRQLRFSRSVAIGGSLLLFFSQFVQVWWSSNCGVFALAPWVAVAWMAIDKRWLRVLLCSYALSVWVLANAYPPFLYAYALAMVIAVVALRPDLLHPARFIDALIALGVAGLVFVSYFGDLIRIMEATVYPGHRMAVGGGIELGKLWAHIYPFALTSGYEPLPPVSRSNACEIGVAASLLPMYCLIFTDYRRLGEVLRSNWRCVGILCAGILFTAIWIFLPVPAALGKWFGLTFVPANRMLAALGWLITILCLYVVDRCSCKPSLSRAGLLVLAVLCAVFTKYEWSGAEWSKTITYFDYLALASSILILCLITFGKMRSWIVLLAIAVVLNLVTFGFFNPIQSAYPIFSINKTMALDHLKTSGAQMSNGVLIAPADYGSLINGAGIPSYNIVLLAPQLRFFSSRFPDLSRSQFNFVFNRYAHVLFNKEDRIAVPTPDSISLPLSRFMGSNGEAHLFARRQFVTTPFCSLDAINGESAAQVKALKLGAPATFAGWFATTDKQSIPDFSVQLRSGSDPVFEFPGHAVATRPDVASAIDGASSERYGFVAVAHFRGVEPGTYSIVLVAQDGETCPTRRKVKLVR